MIMTNTALVVGASGIVGNNLARRLRERGWNVLGLARRPPTDIEGLHPVTADLLDPGSLRDALHGVRPTHVFLATWLRQPTEVENIRVNSAMVRNVLQALQAAGSVKHVALVTGLKHYLGPFESYGKGRLPATPFREEQQRLDIENFYYAQEDELFAASKRDGFGWSVHRPHTIIGYAVGNRWGRVLLERPGKHQAGRQHLVEKGEQAYSTWGRLAVFFTPAVLTCRGRPCARPSCAA